MENVNKSAKRFLKRNIVVIIVAITLMNVSLIGIIIKTGLDKKKNTISLVNEYINNIQMNITKDIYTNETLDLTIYDVEDGQINEKLINDDKITCEKFTVKDGAVLYAYNCKVGNSKTTYDYNKEDKVYPSTEKKEIKKEEKKIIYKDAILNGADPILSDNLIPVIITSDGEVTKADLYEKWYDYTNKEWANAVILKADAKVGEDNKINLDDIESYFVWIPRYKYKLFNTEFNKINKETIDIVFENKDVAKTEGKVNGEYLTHPAFSMQEELNGLWVGKFETTGDATTPTIKPNVSSLRSQNVSTQYATAQNVSNYARMMKNDEWGAVAYLSHSAYGINKQVRINNNSGYKTGCGADTDDKAASSTCDIEYGKVTEYPQSTTGNITGIFDMSGGAWEYVMGVLADSEGKPYSGRHNLYNSDFNGKFGCPTCDSSTSGVDSTKLELTTGTSFPNAKYYNLYTTTNPLTACNGKSCLGHAEAETRGWYGDYYYFPSATSPWVIRGGRCSNGASAGVFNAGSDGGHAISNNSFRVVVPQL